MTGTIGGAGRNLLKPSNINKTISPLYARALKCSALKPVAIKWAFAGHNVANKQLINSIMADGPIALKIKAKVEDLSEKAVIAKAEKIIKRLHSSVGEYLKIQLPGSFLEFAINDAAHFDVNQLFSSSLTCHEDIKDESALQMEHRDIFRITLSSYKNTLLILRALDIASKEHDFTPAILNELSSLFPQFADPRLNVVPENYISLLDTDALLKFAYTLKCLNEINKTNIWNVSFIDMQLSALDDFYVNILKSQTSGNMAIFDIARSSAVSDQFIQKDMFTGPAMKTFLENNKALINFAPALDE